MEVRRIFYNYIICLYNPLNKNTWFLLDISVPNCVFDGFVIIFKKEILLSICSINPYTNHQKKLITCTSYQSLCKISQKGNTAYSVPHQSLYQPPKREILCPNIPSILMQAIQKRKSVIFPLGFSLLLLFIDPCLPKTGRPWEK